MSNLTLSPIVISTFILKIFACDAIVPQPPNDIKSLHSSVKTTFRTLGVGYCIFADALAHCPRKRVMFHASRQRLTVTSVSEYTSQVSSSATLTLLNRTLDLSTMAALPLRLTALSPTPTPSPTTHPGSAGPAT